MKSTKEILVLLVRELINNLDRMRAINQKLQYYNEILGNTSFLLAGLLQSILRNKFSDWRKKWIDDSLISGVALRGNNLKIDGVMIWGINSSEQSEQWVCPFSFEIEIDEEERNFKDFTFLFGDRDKPEITYEKFNGKRDYWTMSNNRIWKYAISSDEVKNKAAK